MKSLPHLLICILTGTAGALLNTALDIGVKTLGLPLFLDTAGTIAAVFYGGLPAGLLCAVLTNITLTFLIAQDAAIYAAFVLCNILTALLTWQFCKITGILSPPRPALSINKQATAVRGFHSAIETGIALFCFAMVLVAAMSVLGGLIAFFINVFFETPLEQTTELHKVPGGWALSWVVIAFLRTGAGSLAAQILARLPANIPDRLISVFAAYTIFRLLPKRRREKEAGVPPPPPPPKNRRRLKAGISKQ